MKNIALYPVLVAVFLWTGTGEAFSQESIDKEIVVVKPYQPSLSDAIKINVMPKVSDSIHIHPSFDYAIEPRKYETRFQVRPISAARLVGVPLSKLYKSYLELGIGNHMMPLAVLDINSLRSKKSQWGIAFRHYSINGKLKLDDGQKIAPGFFENSGTIHAKRIFTNSALSGKARFAYDGGNFYGLSDTTLARDDITQNYLKIDGILRLGSIYNDSLHLNYSGQLEYRYTMDHYRHEEHGMILTADLDRLFASGSTYGFEFLGSYYNSGGSIDSANNTVMELSPWMSKTTGEYSYRIGLKLSADAHGKSFNPYLHPVARLQINVVKRILMPYFGVDGGLQVNDFRNVASENRYVTPGLKVLNTHQKIRGYAGLKGSYTSQLSYDMGFSYALYQNMLFFVNDTGTVLGNTFDADYDDAELLELYARLQYNGSEKLRFVLEGSYDQYKLDTLPHPWHKPSLKLSLNTRYNLKNKIIADAGIHYVGKRFARSDPPSLSPVTLAGYADLDAGLEYRYTKILSAFIRFYNILGTENYLWNRYPGVGFTVLAGISYVL